MTALAGLWWFDRRPGAGEALTRMLAAQSHYGPHHATQWQDEGLALGRQLFRILPEDAFDDCVAGDRQDKLVMVADARLDNRDELADALGVTQSEAAASSDAMLLLAGFARWDEAVLDRLVGDFAFAVWDRRQHRLVLARDPLGQRPLHYHRGQGFFAFASMPKGLHALPQIPYAPDIERTAEFLALLPEAGPRSFFSGIDRVEVGHVVTVTASGLIARRYWNPARPGDAHRRDYVEGLRHHLDQAVRARLRGAGPAVGSHLSAGLDSSAVTATAARLLAPQGGEVDAFTAVPRQGYEGQIPLGRLGDEGPAAAAIVAHYPNIRHTLIRAGSRSPLQSLDRDFFLYQRPVLNLCNHTWDQAILDAVRQRGLRVLLTGTAGNLAMSYDGLHWIAELAAARRWGRLLREGRALMRNRTLRARGVAALALGSFLPAPLWRLASCTFRGTDLNILRYTALAPEALGRHGLAEKSLARGHDFSWRPRRDGFAARLTALQRFDTGTWNKGVLAGWGIDQRDPTTDRRLVEYCLATPMEEFLQDGQPRSLIRRALADRLPATALEERRKGLQGIDWHEGFAADRAAAMTEIERLADCSLAAETIDLARLGSLMQNLPQDGWHRDEVVQDYRLALLRGLAAGHFLRKAAGSNR